MSILLHVCVMGLFFACAKEGAISLSGTSQNGSPSTSSTTGNGQVSVTNVQVVNDRFIVTGSNLHTVALIKVKNTSIDKTLQIESKSSNTLTAFVPNLPILAITVGQIFDLVITSASAQSIVPIQFVISNGAITSSKLAAGSVTPDKITDGTLPLAKLSGSGASSGQVATWNGSAWVPANPTGGSGSGGGGSYVFGNGLFESGGNVDVVTGTGPDDILQLDSSGDLNIAGVLRFPINGGVGFVSGAVNEWRLQNDNDDFAVELLDNIGISQRVPLRMEDLTSGDVRLTFDVTELYIGSGAGAYGLPVVDGTVGQVLQTDGSGTVSWASVAAGGVTSVSVGASLAVTSPTTTPTVSIANTMTAGTYTKVSVNAQGLVTNSFSLTAGDIPTGINPARIGSGNMTMTEFEHLSTISSDVQDQFNAKEPLIGTGNGTDYWRGDKTWRDFATDAKSAAVANALNNGTTDVAPSQDIVYDQLDLKVDDSEMVNYVELTGDTMSGVLSFANENEIRFYENTTNGTNYVALKAPALLGNNYIFNLPNGSGTAGQVLATDGSGILSWVTQSSGADNLGNHTATANISLGSNFISGDGNSEGIAVDGSGKVGIGTGSPGAQLHVSESLTGTPMILESTTPTTFMQLKAGGAGRGYFGWTNAGDDGLTFLNAAGNAYNFLITDSGKVGLAGEVSPQAVLDINGSGATSATKGLLVNDSGGLVNLEVQDGGDVLTRNLLLTTNIVRKQGANGAGFGFGDFGSVSIYGNSGGYSAFSVGSNGVGMKLMGAIANQTDRPVISLANTDFGTQFSAASGVQYFADLSQTINQSATAGYTMLDMDVTESTVGSGEKRLVDLKVGGDSKFVVKNDGSVRAYQYCDEAGANCKDASTGLYDNLGNHTATQTLNLNGQWINGDNTAAEGIFINTNGNVGVGTATTTGYRLNVIAASGETPIFARATGGVNPTYLLQVQDVNPTNRMTLSGTGVLTTGTVVSSNVMGTPLYTLRNDSVTTGNEIGQINFKSSQNGEATYAEIATVAEDISGGVQDGELLFKTLINGTLTEGMRLSNDGRLGITQTAPLYKIHVRDNGETARFQSFNNASHRLRLYSGEGGNFVAGDYDGQSVFNLYNDNANGVGKGLKFVYGTRSANIDDGSYPAALEFAPRGQVGTRTALFLNNLGRVGVGTNAPDEELHVVGNIKMVDGNQAAGKVLTSDVNGVATWQTPGSGADHLGNHTATQTLNMNGQWINGDSTASEGIFINTAGQVGLNNAAPSERLDLSGNVEVNGTYPYYALNTGSGFYYLQADINLAGSAQGDYFSIFTPANKGFNFGNKLVIEPAGKVGIGTTTPSVGMLHIESKAAADYPLWIVPHASQTSNMISVRNFVNNGYTFELTPQAVLRLRDPSNGGRNIILNTTAAANPRIEGNAIGVDYWTLGYGASNDIAIRSGGNIGIGTVAPDSKLHVVGNIKMVDGNQAAGKVLTSDANGVATWQTSGAGADNLGNHTATQLLNMNGQWINGDSTASEGLFVDTSGRLGIGTGAPGAMLHVVDGTFNMKFSAADGLQVATTGNTGWVNIGTLNGAPSLVWHNLSNVAKGAIDNIGRLGVGTTTPYANLEVSNDTDGSDSAMRITSSDVAFANNQELRVDFAQTTTLTGRQSLTYFNPDWGFNFYGYNSGLNTSPIMTLRGSGMVGVGTPAPDTKLSVVGGSGTNFKANIRSTSNDDGNGYSLFSTNVTYNNPFTLSTASDWNTGDPIDPDFIGGLFDWNATTGGFAVIGNSNSSSVPGLTFAANQGVTGGSRAAFFFTAATQAAGSRSTIPNGSSLVAVENNGAQKFAIYGDGKVLAYEYCDENGTNCKDSSSGLYDNLGNHTATTTLNMNGQWINGDSTASEGMFVNASGNVGIGTGGPGSLLHLYQAGISNTGLTINQDFHNLNLKIDNHVGILSHTNNMRMMIGNSIIMETNGAASVIGNHSPSFPRGLMVTPLSDGYKGMVLRGLPAQTGNLLEWQNSAGTVLGLFDEVGNIGMNVATPLAKIHIDETAANTEGMIIDTAGGGSSLTLRDRVSTSRSITLGHTGNGLTITGGNAGATGFRIFGASSDLYLGSDNSDVYFNTSGSTRMFIQDTGEIGIGTVAPAWDLHVSKPNKGTVLMVSNSQTTSGGPYNPVIAVANYGGPPASYPYMLTVNARGTEAAPTILGVNEVAGIFGAMDGSNLGVPLTMINSFTGPNHASGDMEGVMTFVTTDSSSNTERMRITHDGKVGIWTTAPTAPLHIYRNTANSFASFQSDNATIGGGTGSPTGTVTSVTNDSCNGGSAGWAGMAPGNLQTQDGSSFANVNMNGGGTISQYLKATSHGFSIPAGATINGIELSTVTRNWNGSSISYYDLYLIRSGDGCTAGTDLAGGNVSGTSWNTQTFGGATSLWGRTWTASDINNAAFGIVVSFQCNSSCGSAGVDMDMLRLKVYYTDVGGTANVTWSAGTKNSTGAYVISKSADMASNNFFTLDTNGNLTVSGTVTQNSDATLKEDIRPLTDSLEKILALEGVSYVWRDRELEGRRQIGLIAQDVQRVFPELVRQSEDGTLSVNYIGLIAPLIEAMKEQHLMVLYNHELFATMHKGLDDRLSSAEREIASLKEENAKLKSKVDQIHSFLCQKDKQAPFCQ